MGSASSHTSDAIWRAEFPFPSKYLRVQGHRFHYIDEGSGPALVFSHGNPTWCFYWRKLLAGLQQQYRVIAVDHLGSGWSDKPRQYPYSLAQHSENLAGILEYLKITGATLIGHDWGGAIGLHCALCREPQRFQRFILCNTGAFPPPRIPRRISICRGPLLGRFLIRGLNVFPRAALRMAVSPKHRWSAAAREGILAPYGSWHDRIGIWSFVRDIPTTRRHPTYATLRQLESQLPRLDHFPVALIWGLRDWCFDVACLDRLCSQIPTAEVTKIEEAGHWVVEDAPAEVLQAVRGFLERHPGTENSWAPRHGIGRTLA